MIWCNSIPQHQFQMWDVQIGSACGVLLSRSDWRQRNGGYHGVLGASVNSFHPEVTDIFWGSPPQEMSVTSGRHGYSQTYAGFE